MLHCLTQMTNQPITRIQACGCGDNVLLGLKAASVRGKVWICQHHKHLWGVQRETESVDVRGHRSDWAAIGERQQKVKDHYGLQDEASLKAQRINGH